MTPKELAQLLNGRQYGSEITKEEERQAKEDGLVVIFWYSDDNAEIRGAIHGEIDCYEGWELFFEKDGIFTNKCSESDCPYFFEALEKAKKVEAIWEEDSYTWTYKTDIPHETFDILDGEDKHCRGIVFQISSLQ